MYYVYHKTLTNSRVKVVEENEKERKEENYKEVEATGFMNQNSN
jgi:hypothetical protein